MSRIVLGVAGGIAAYKACELLRRLQGAGHEVTVVPTPAALEFVGASTWAALSGGQATSLFDDVHCAAVRSGRRSTWSSLRLRPLTCSLGPRRARR